MYCTHPNAAALGRCFAGSWQSRARPCQAAASKQNKAILLADCMGVDPSGRRDAGAPPPLPPPAPTGAPGCKPHARLALLSQQCCLHLSCSQLPVSFGSKRSSTFLPSPWDRCCRGVPQLRPSMAAAHRAVWAGPPPGSPALRPPTQIWLYSCDRQRRRRHDAAPQAAPCGAALQQDPRRRWRQLFCRGQARARRQPVWRNPATAWAEPQVGVVGGPLVSLPSLEAHALF